MIMIGVVGLNFYIIMYLLFVCLLSWVRILNVLGNGKLLNKGIVYFLIDKLVVF